MQFAADACLGEYRIVRPIGAGGMGEVYLASDRRLDREVALKVLPAAMAADGEWRRRFMHEAKAASRVSHPNAAAIYEVGEVDGLCFIAMEYVAGRTLAEIIAGEQLALPEVIRIAASLGGVLSAAHEAGVTHRDLKPGNIMLSSRGEVKLLDFGLAKSTQAAPAGGSTLSLNTATGMIMGTISYMSPEQALGRPVDPRSDIFSFGVVLYEVLGGRRPFDGATATETLDRILHAQPLPLARLNFEVPPGLEWIVRKCLEKDRESRYQSARELTVDLRNLDRDSQTMVRLDSAPPSTANAAAVSGPPPERRRWLLGAAGGAGLAAAAGAGAWFRWGRPAAVPSLAVLPLVNSGASDRDYLAEGVTESLINQISKVRSVRVMSRSAVYRFAGKDMDTLAAAKKLNVGAVLTGRMQTAGPALSLYVELVEADSGRLLWGHQFKTSADGLQRTQDDIVREVLAKLGVALEPQERTLLARQPGATGPAFEQYLKGRFYWNKRSLESITTAIGYFNAAIEADPNFALAQAGLSDSYSMLSGAHAPREVFPKAKWAALRALEIDETLSEGHAALAYVKFNFDWDWLETERELKRATQLNPGNPQAYSFYARYLNAMGRYQDAIQAISKARELDPLSLAINTGLGLAHYFGRQYGKAIDQYKSTLALDASFTPAHYNLAAAYVQQRRYPEAIAEFEAALRQVGTDAGTIAELGQANALMGKPEEARKALARVMELAGKRYVNPSFIAWIHEGLGERDKAFEWLRKGYDDRSWPMVFLRVDPKYDSLRGDPRFTEIQRLVGL